MRFFLRSKIHNAVVTQAELGYIGSITIDEDLMDKAGLLEHERVLIVNNTNGQRLETYVIKGERGSGIIGANGAAVHRLRKGDSVIIMAFEGADKPPEAKIVLVDGQNRFLMYYTGPQSVSPDMRSRMNPPS